MTFDGEKELILKTVGLSFVANSAVYDVDF